MVLGFYRRDKIFGPSEKINEYNIERVIGEGRYGICYQTSKDQKPYIIKQLKMRMLKKSGLKVHFEEEILKTLEHQSIPRFVKKIEAEDFCGYVLEFKEGRTFEDIVYLDRYAFSREEIFNVARQLIDILKYLHCEGIVHRDIRVPNTLYDHGKVNLVDFGLARWINQKRYRADMDFAFLGDFMLHLYYSSFELGAGKKRPWHEELDLSGDERLLLSRLMGIEQRYTDINQVEHDFYKAYDGINK